MGETANGHTLNIMRMFYMAETQEQAEKEAREGINAHYQITFGLSRNWGRSGAIAKARRLAPNR